MSEPLWIPLWVALSYVGVYSGYKAMETSRRWWQRQNPDLTDSPLEKRLAPIYCKSCGEMLVSVRQQVEFNPQTAAPVYRYSRRCPHWSPGAMALYDDVNCNRPISFSSVVQGHNHADPTAGSARCPACIDVMLKDRIIGPAEASRLYTEAL